MKERERAAKEQALKAESAALKAESAAVKEREQAAKERAELAAKERAELAAKEQAAALKEWEQAAKEQGLKAESAALKAESAALKEREQAAKEQALKAESAAKEQALKEQKIGPLRAGGASITPRRVANVLWRRRLVCSVVAAVVVLVGVGWLFTREKIYQSTSSVALLPVSANSGVLPNYPNLISSLIPTYVQLVSSPVLLNRVAAALPFTVSETQLANDVHAESLSNAAVVTIVADRPNALQAQEIAARTTAVFLTHLDGNGVVIPQVYSQPTVPDSPTFPRVKLVLGVVLALAVILGLGAGLAWEAFYPK